MEKSISSLSPESTGVEILSSSSMEKSISSVGALRLREAVTELVMEMGKLGLTMGSKPGLKLEELELELLSGLRT